VDGRLEHAVTLLRDVRGARLAALFAPEHGLWGAPQDHATIATERDPVTGLRATSLYGTRRQPTPAMLRGLDLLVIDLQDVGSRYYTFQWTMALAIRACARAGVRVLVLDRPNPLGGEIVEGNLPLPGFESFVGAFRHPVRHGLTLGEIVLLELDPARERRQLRVVEMVGWRRAMHWPQTGRAWLAPSPNMPSYATALVYPGFCLLEGTQLSEGRGTARPFLLLGAPDLSPVVLADCLEARRLPGLRFVPTYFRPQFQKHAGRQCGGVETVVVEPSAVVPYRAGVEVLAALWQCASGEPFWRREPYEFVADRPAIDLLAGDAALRRGIESGDWAAWVESWRDDEAAFRARRAPVLLYGEA
jgi:uncharacterized protein YbbC (DUF1343 family)